MDRAELEREVERFSQFRRDTCAARHVLPKPERDVGVSFPDVQHCLSCGMWSRMGEAWDCPFGWDEDLAEEGGPGR